MSALWPIMYKEFLHIVRDKRSIGAALLLPLILLVMFGYAIRLDVQDVEIAVLDQDDTPLSRELVATLGADGAVRVAHHPASEDALDALLQRGRVRMGIVVPPGFGASLAGGTSAPVQVVVDGSEASFAGLALAHVGGSLAHAATTRVSRSAATMGVEVPGVASRPRVFYNEPLDGRWFIVPGLIGVITMMLAGLLTSQCVAREYERNTIEQILVSPVGGVALMVGKLVPYVGVGVIQILIVTLASRFLFEVPIRGSLLLLAIATLLFLTGSMALGLMLSAVLKSQQVAMQVAMIVTMLPSLLLSGFVFPLENIPWWIRWTSWLVPARYYVEISRGLFLKGVGLETLWPELVAMVVYALLMLVLATTRFRRSLS